MEIPIVLISIYIISRVLSQTPFDVENIHGIIHTGSRFSEFYRIRLSRSKEDLLVIRQRKTSRKDPISHRKNKQFTHATETPVVCASTKSSSILTGNYFSFQSYELSLATRCLGQLNEKKFLLPR